MPNVLPSSLASKMAAILRFWTSHPEMKLNGVTLEQLQADVDNFNVLLGDLAQAEEAVLTLRNQRNASRKQLLDVITRIRSGTRSYFGSDSTEYELVGGTRKSERKRPVRRARATTEPRAAT